MSADSFKKLKDQLNMFQDIEFIYNGKDYFICPINGVYSAGEVNTDGVDYKTVDDLLNNFKVDGQSLEKIADKIINF